MAKIMYIYDTETSKYSRIKIANNNFNKLLFGLLTTLSIAVGIILYVRFDTPIDDGTNKEIKARIKSLEKISLDLEALNEFITIQKLNLEEQNQILGALKKENKTLEKVLDINKENVNAIFQIQEDRIKRKIWVDRILGFLFGVAGSLVAAIILRFMEKKSTPSLNDEIYEMKK